MGERRVMWMRLNGGPLRYVNEVLHGEAKRSCMWTRCMGELFGHVDEVLK